ncbi:MAG: T9SS type A sorting domain-containing protein [Bacteroidales bacterium]|nr:T9SS type A sorting domain-containing protein [Bacteroidales bacterium]
MMKFLQSILVFLFALLITTSVSAQNDTLKTSFGEGADTYVSNDEQSTDPPPDGSGPASIHGTEEYLKIRNHEVRQKIVYLKFDIFDNPRFNDASGAFLGLYILHAGKMAEATLTVSIYGMTDDTQDFWLDTELSYNTAPGMLPADLNSYQLDLTIVEKLTELIIPVDYTGYIYTEPVQEMDDFINADQNGILTLILLVENINTGDELRIAPEEDLVTNNPPLLHGDAPVNIEDEARLDFKLDQNYPNPYNGNTTLTYKLDEPKNVGLKIYNVLGIEVATLVNEFQNSGEYTIELDMNKGSLQLPGGIYYARLNTGSHSKTIRMIFTK